MHLRVIYRECGRDRYTDVPHEHEGEFELIHVLSGTGKVFLGERVIPFCKDAVFLFDARVLHYVSPEGDVPYVRSKLLIGKSLVEQMLSPLLCEGYLYRVPTPEQSAKADRMLDVLHTLLEKGGEPFHTCAQVFELLHLCTAQMREKQGYCYGTVADVVGYIYENLEGGVTLSDVAQALHINKHYLCRLFKGETGMTVGEYISSARIVRAKQLLRTPGVSIGFVASESGYNEPSAFSKIFKKEVGMTPSEYKARYAHGT